MYPVLCVQGEALNYIMPFGRLVSRLHYGDFNAGKDSSIWVTTTPTVQRTEDIARKIKISCVT